MHFLITYRVIQMNSAFVPAVFVNGKHHYTTDRPAATERCAMNKALKTVEAIKTSKLHFGNTVEVKQLI